jgi:hypothetical protein
LPRVRLVQTPVIASDSLLTRHGGREHVSAL